MPITNLVECAVNLAEKVTGVDLDRDGDVGQRTSNESGAVTSSTVRSPVAPDLGLSFDTGVIRYQTTPLIRRRL